MSGSELEDDAHPAVPATEPPSAMGCTMGTAIRRAFLDVQERAKSAANGDLYGFPALDRVMWQGLAPGRVTLVAARPGEGKSALVVRAAMRVAAAVPTQVFLTDSRLEEFAFAGLGFPGFSITRDEWERVTSKATAASNLDLWVHDDARTIERIAADLRWSLPSDDEPAAGARGLLVVDTIHGLESSARHSTETRADELARIARRTAAIAVEYRLHVLITAQLTTPDSRARDRSREPWPSHGDIHDCRALAMIPDSVVMMRTLPTEDDLGALHPVQIAVVKNRGGGSGSFVACLVRGELRALPDELEGEFQEHHW